MTFPMTLIITLSVVLCAAWIALVVWERMDGDR